MNRREIPVFELSEYGLTELGGKGVYVGTLTETLANHQNRLRPHCHPFFQVFLLKGVGTFMHDFVEYRLDRPSIVFTSPGQVHAIKAGHSFMGMVVSFTQGFFDDRTPPPSKLLEYPFLFSAERRPVVSLSHQEYRLQKQIFDDLQKEFSANMPGASEIVRAYLSIIFARAARYESPATSPETPARPAKLVRQFLQAVENNFRTLTSLTDYSKRLNVTANHLNDTLRANTGHSAGEVIRERRLLDAKRLLAHSELTMAEIGYSLGFEDPSYFSRFFRRYVHQTPAEFRTRIREKYQ